MTIQSQELDDQISQSPQITVNNHRNELFGFNFVKPSAPPPENQNNANEKTKLLDNASLMEYERKTVDGNSFLFFKTY